MKARVAGSVISLACCREPALDRARGLFGNPGRRERRVNADDQRGAGSEREGGRRQDAIFRQPARIPQGSRRDRDDERRAGRDRQRAAPRNQRLPGEGADIWRPEAQEGTELRLKPPEGTHAPLKHLRKRRSTAYALRVERARHWRHFHFQPPLANDDEVKYPDGWANFSKSLPHDHLGHLDPAAFEALVYACRTGRPMDFAAIAGSDD